MKEIPKYVFKKDLASLYNLLHVYVYDTILPIGHVFVLNQERVKLLYNLGGIKNLMLANTYSIT